MRVLVGIAVGCALLLCSLLVGGGHLRSEVQGTAFVMVVGLAAGLTLLKLPARDIVAAYGRALRGRESSPLVFQVVGRNFLSAGFIGAFIGLAHVMQHLYAPDKLGAAVAVLFISLLYGFLGYLFGGLAFEASLPAGPPLARPPLPRVVVGALLIGIGLAGVLLAGWHLSDLQSLAAALATGAGLVVVAISARRIGSAPAYLANGALASGVAGIIFGLIHMMENLSDAHALGQGLFAAFFSMFYATVSALMLLSLGRDEKETGGSEGASVGLRSLLALSIAAVGLLVLTVALVFYAVRRTDSSKDRPKASQVVADGGAAAPAADGGDAGSR